MKFPPYSEFLKTVTVEDYEAIAKKVNERIGNGEVDGKQVSVADKMAAFNLAATVNFIELYHNWLSEQV